MNPNEPRTLVRIKHGSHLYGTSTPQSDLDFKGVHVPSAVSILLQKREDVIDRSILTKVDKTQKNSKDDIDEQSYSVQKFLKMLSKGDTVATEILFAPPEMIEYADPQWPLLQSMAKTVINKQVIGFVSYCQRQAAKYGVKGSRMAAVEDLCKLLEAEVTKRGKRAKLLEIAPQLEEFAATHEFSEIVPIDAPKGPIDHLDVCSRKVPVTGTISGAFDIYNKVFQNYGARARAAKDNEGIDWKAMSHAVRVARQAIELLTTQHISFPRPDAEELLAIKRGEVDFKVVGGILEDLVEQLTEAAEVSELPDKTDPMRIETASLFFNMAQVRQVLDCTGDTMQVA